MILSSFLLSLLSTRLHFHTADFLKVSSLTSSFHLSLTALYSPSFLFFLASFPPGLLSSFIVIHALVCVMPSKGSFQGWDYQHKANPICSANIHITEKDKIQHNSYVSQVSSQFSPGTTLLLDSTFI